MKILKLTFILICSLLFANSNLQAQAPEKINYQAVARNLAGLPLVNQTINVKYEIRQGFPTGTVVYAENHTLTTNQFGLFIAEIGGGTPITGTFPGIAWGTSPFYLFVEVDGDAMGVTQLLSVPYALYAKESANGPAGLPGKNSLSLSTPYSGPFCTNSGSQIEVGLDDNNDGVLQPLEIDFTYYICNGVDGIVGTNGIDGFNTLTTANLTAACSNGGYQIDMGLDANNNSILDASEITTTYNICHGTNGIDGINGTNGVNINWLGSLNTPPLTPNFNDAYYNTSSGQSFIWDGIAWQIIAQDGTTTIYSAGTGINIAAGNIIENTGDLDSLNEIQTLSISNDTIFLSNGGYAILPTSSTGFWSTFGGLNIHNNNPGNVGIGTTTPLHQLSVASNDSVVASFFGTNPNVSAILVANVNANAATGIVFFNGVDTTSYIFLTPTNNALTIRNNSVNGNILISTDSIIVNQGLILVNQAQNSIYNEADTIYNYSPSGTIVHVNQGLFLTDSLYVLGNNAANVNWVLANDGSGQAKWTDPNLITSGGDQWGSQVVIHDTTLTGTGIAGTPLSVNPNIIPTQTSQLTNNSGFITSPNDADTSVTNEIELPATAVANQVLTWDGSAWVAQNPGSGADNWGSQVVIHDTTLTGTGIVGDALSVNPNIIPTQTSQLTNNSGFITSPNDADFDPTNELQTISKAGGVVTLSNGGGSFTDDVNDADFNPTNEIQNLSVLGNNINISGGGIGTTFSSTAPALNQVLTWNGTNWVAQNAALGADNQDLSLAGNTLSLTNDGSPVNLTPFMDNTDAQTLSFVSPNLSILGGNTVNLSALTGPTYTAGTGINLAGNIITNTAPDQAVGLNGAGTTSIGGAYPNFTITSTEVDGSVSNELITSFGVNGANLEIIEAGNSWNVPLASFSGAGKWTENAGMLFPTTLANNVGIGTNNPLSKLHVFEISDPLEVVLENGGGAFKTGYSVKTGAGQSWFMGKELTPDFVIKDETVGQVRLQIATNGNVGIGTTAPLANLHVEGFNSYLRLQSTQNTSAANSIIEFGNTIAGTFDSKGSVGNPGSGDHMEYNAATFHRFTTNGNERMRLTNTGELGIGTFAPEATTHIIVPNGLSKALQLGNPNQPTAEWIFDVDASGYLNIINENFGTPKNVISADNTGNVGIGIPLPNDILHVAGNNFGQYIKNENYGSGNPTGYRLTTPDRDWLFLQNLGGTPVGSLTFYDLTAGANRFHISTTGDVGVGVIPTAKLHIGGVSGVDGIRFPDGTLQTTAAVGGSGWALTGNAGTNATTNFIGTTDNVALNFRVNNQTAGKIDSLYANSFFGFLAGANTSGTGAQNTAIGFQSLNTNTTGGYNTALGYRSLRNNNTGTYNTAIGADALQQNTGSYNTATGYTSLRANTTGTQNTATGSYALFSNNTGYDNTATGANAMQNNINGVNNTATGTGALNMNSTGNSNTAYGYFALSNNVNGNNGTAIGYYAMQYAYDGATFDNYNVAVGYEALRGSVTPASNTGNTNAAVGYQSLMNNTSGNSNTAIGYGALFNNTTSSGNTVLGSGAGYSFVNGNYNTFIGYNTGASANGFTNSTAIGANATVSQSNSLVLGNAANVGIGTSTPTAKLDVNGTIVISGANTNELNRAQTGAANLVPIAYGSVGAGAAITNAGTGNWSVVAGGAGQYTITVTGETFVGSSHIMSGTMNGTYGFISLIAFTNNILVQTTNTGGVNQNAAFSFIVYKP